LYYFLETLSLSFKGKNKHTPQGKDESQKVDNSGLNETYTGLKNPSIDSLQ
tara:strand:- start:477 stop:629 length:153 start_codon:yes stop_codon:yes gene_type:complete